MKRLAIFFLSLLLFSPVQNAFGIRNSAVSSLRCNANLVLVGETKLDVIAKCGQPFLMEQSGEEFRLTVPGFRSRLAEEWVYDFGPSDFVYTLSFEGVRLVRIAREQQRGYGFIQ